MGLCRARPDTLNAMNERVHAPVLLQEVVELFSPVAGETLVDLTVGLGGHAGEIATKLGQDGRVVAMDRDAGNLARSQQRLQERWGGEIISIHASFAEIGVRLETLGVQADMVLADLGFSSNQMDDPDRGFSMKADGPLDMRLDVSDGTTAADLVATLSETELADMIFHLGEEPLSRRIARKVVQSRSLEPIRTTAHLARIVCEAYGPRARASRMHPATRTFMALRIAVNDELNALASLMDQVERAAESAGGWLRPGARVAVISFHSLEDRMVKQAFARMAERGLATRLTRKPIIASAEEIAANPRARSAKLRGIRIVRTSDSKS